MQAVGSAEAAYRAKRLPEMRKWVEEFDDDEVVIVCGGDGTTSEGEFWEALNTASNLRLPVVFVIEDNEYAISVPVEVQTTGGSISKLVEGFPNLEVFRCDGTDLIDSWVVSGKAIEHARSGGGPALLHAHTVRLRSHSESERRPRLLSPTRARGAGDARSDPEGADADHRGGVRGGGGARPARGDARRGGVPGRGPGGRAPSAGAGYGAPVALLGGEVDPTSPRFDTEGEEKRGAGGGEHTMVDLLRVCLRDEMERDPRIVCFGQDVADASREEVLDEVPGKGGVFKVTHGLQRTFGGERVFNAPLAEANIVGRAYGMAVRGLKPVVEIQFFDYIWPAMQQIRNEVATLRYRSGGAWSAPMVIRVPYGGYLKGGSLYHSQTGAGIFAHTPGVRVVLPSTARDANGLLRTAIRCDDPVLFLEHKHLYRQVHNKGSYPGNDFMIPFGKAKVVRPGADVTVVACGALVKRSLDAARIAWEADEIDVEVIDLRTISPLDMERVGESVQKTNRVIIAHEDARSFGMGAEVASRIADELFPWLEAPVRRVAALDVWVAYAPRLEAAILPQVADVLGAIRELADY